MFSKLDLANAYQQLELDEHSTRYVTINTHLGLFKYNHLPFGVGYSACYVPAYDGVAAEGHSQCLRLHRHR